MSESFSHFDGVLIDHQEKSEQIKKPEQTLDSILNVELNVENINSYASDAFNNLVSFADKKVADYRKINSTEGLSYKDVEDATFKYYGLENIDSILDYISDKSKEIRDLDKVVARADKIDNIIIQPDIIFQNISNNGSGEFKEKRIIDRLKTVLFVLKEDFDVDINNEEDFSIQKGVVDKNMMRKTSYYLLNAPTINRTILICDEEGNASYVFNSKKIAEKEINNNSLIKYTKSELNDLLKEDPEIGRRVVYSKEGFVSRIIDSIKNPTSVIPDEISSSLKDVATGYLYPKAPEDYLSASAISKELGFDTHQSVLKVIENIKDQLGEVSRYKFGTMRALGYSPEQQEIIKKHLEKRGLFQPEAPEGYLSIKGIAKKFEIAPHSILKVIEDIKDQLGEISKYRFTNKRAPGYSPEQQEVIKKYLKERGLFQPEAPEGYLSALGISKELGITNVSALKVVENIVDQLGEVSRYKFGTMRTLGYSPEQQEVIKKYLKERGLFQPEAPEGYLSASAISKELGIDHHLALKAVKDIADQLGDISKYRFGKSSVVLGYSPEQQKLIINYINSKKKK